MRHARSAALLLLLCAIAVLASGCSLRKLAYQFGDRLMVREVDGTFDLSGAQKERLRGQVRELLRWHRGAELPRYVAVLTRLEGEAQAGFTRPQLATFFTEAQAASERLMQRAAPIAGDLLASLSDEQIAHAARALEREEQERWKGVDAGGDTFLRRRLKLAEKQMKTWLGGATETQIEVIATFLGEHRADDVRRRDLARRGRLEFLQALRAHPGKEALTALVLSWMTESKGEQQSREAFLDLLVRLDGMLAPAQRNHLVSEIGGWRRDLADLSGIAGTPGG